MELGNEELSQVESKQTEQNRVTPNQAATNQAEASQKELLATMRACEGLDMNAIPENNDVNAAWCLRFLRAIRDVAFATVDENGLPAVRIIDVMAVTPNSLYFLAPRGKAFHADVVREGYVAIVGQTSDFRTCRLRGRAVLPQGEDVQHALVDALFELNPSMNEIYPGEARYICDVFCVSEGEGEYFDLGQKPIFRYGFTLGAEGRAARPHRKGTFFIGDACTGCGTCVSACPEQCIALNPAAVALSSLAVLNPGAASSLSSALNPALASSFPSAPTTGSAKPPFVIDQSHCLRCGICEEICPSGSICKN